MGTKWTKFRLSSLIPAGLIAERPDEDNVVVIVSELNAADRRFCPFMQPNVRSRSSRLRSDSCCFALQRHQSPTENISKALYL